MRYFIFLILLLSKFSSIAQVAPNVDPSKLLGKWVKTSLTYFNGDELSDANSLKYNYTKYDFRGDNTLWISSSYDSEGMKNFFEIKGNMIYLKTSAGYPLNKFKIDKVTADSLIIYESDESYNENPYALKYKFVNEQYFIDHLPLEPKDVYLVTATDTIYNVSQKIHPKFAGIDLNDFFSRELGNKKKPKDGLHLVSFIISKKGGIDSLKTLKTMGPKFEEMFEKSFKKTQNMWTPAYLNGKPVSVLRYCRIRYYGDIGNFFLEQNANALYQNQEFDKALPLFKQVFEIRKDDTELMYKIGICKLVAGDADGACKDWNTAKELGNTAVIPLLKKYCKP